VVFLLSLYGYFFTGHVIIVQEDSTPVRKSYRGQEPAVCVAFLSYRTEAVPAHLLKSMFSYMEEHQFSWESVLVDMDSSERVRRRMKKQFLFDVTVFSHAQHSMLWLLNSGVIGACRAPHVVVLDVNGENLVRSWSGATLKQSIERLKHREKAVGLRLEEGLCGDTMAIEKSSAEMRLCQPEKSHITGVVYDRKRMKDLGKKKKKK
jgi:hypothetical protein